MRVRGSHGAGWTPGVLIPQNWSWLERKACKEIWSQAKEWLGATTVPEANSCSYAPSASHMDSQGPRQVCKPSRACWGEHLILFLPVSCRFTVQRLKYPCTKLQTCNTIIMIALYFGLNWKQERMCAATLCTWKREAETLHPEVVIHRKYSTVSDEKN